MLKKRKQYNNEFKFRVSLEACKGQKTLNELATAHGIHPNQISQWKRQFLEEANRLRPGQRATSQSARTAEVNFTNKSGDCKWSWPWLKKSCLKRSQANGR